MTVTRYPLLAVFIVFLLHPTTSASSARQNDPAMQRALESLIDQVKQCWTIRPYTTGVAVIVRVEFNRDGSISGSPTLHKPRHSPRYKDISQLALKAVADCAPYQAVRNNPHKYGKLREMLFYFE
uniref:cell envelope integrity protein TolA n=1 Tax=Ochrobactrum sp. LM19 TaxID=1449781 RepID=UPI0015E8023E|nr:cell envelope integrity protein TolA [Ochrobactrum sp. LM19]